MCVSLSVIRCNNNPVQLKGVGISCQAKIGTLRRKCIMQERGNGTALNISHKRNVRWGSVFETLDKRLHKLCILTEEQD